MQPAAQAIHAIGVGPKTSQLTTVVEHDAFAFLCEFDEYGVRASEVLIDDGA